MCWPGCWNNHGLDSCSRKLVTKLSSWVSSSQLSCHCFASLSSFLAAPQCSCSNSSNSSSSSNTSANVLLGSVESVGVEVYAVDKEEEKSVKNKPHFKNKHQKRKHSKVLVMRHRSKFKELTRNRKVGYWPNHWWCLLLWSPSQAVLNRIE